LETKIKNH